MAGSAGTARGVMGLYAGATGDSGTLDCAPGGCTTGASGGKRGGAKAGGGWLVDVADRRRGEALVSEGIRARVGVSGLWTSSLFFFASTFSFFTLICTYGMRLAGKTVCAAGTLSRLGCSLPKTFYGGDVG